VGILILSVDHAFIPPVPQAVRRRGPAYIISGAVYVPSEEIMRPVNINPIPKAVGFPVRNIFPVGKIGIDNLFPLHTNASLLSNCAVGNG
jgi:hypothetical protein